MTQRNPLNERYQDESRIGHTRKSAASAKPKTSAASTVTLQSTKKTPREKKIERRQKEREQQQKERELQVVETTPNTPEYLKWRRLYWISLGVAIFFILISWLIRELNPQWISLVFLAFAYAGVIFAFWVDFSKVKKIVRKWREEQIEKARKANRGKSKKQIQEEREAALEEEKRKAREAAEKTIIGRIKKKITKNKHDNNSKEEKPSENSKQVEKKE